MVAKGNTHPAEIEAWNRYLAWTQRAKSFDYDDIEAKAWATLQSELAQIPKPKPKKKVVAHA